MSRFKEKRELKNSTHGAILRSETLYEELLILFRYY
jgi:hypothetical protein